MKTQIVNLSNKQAAALSVATLSKGGIVVLPTESSYGIAVDATNRPAVARVYSLKKRSGGKFMPVIVASVAMAKKFFLLNRNALKLCKLFPAPLTLVVKQRGKKLARNLSADRTVAFRVSANKFCRDVSRRLKKPITSTSANISGKEATFSFRKAQKLFAGKVELIIDAGVLPRRKPSTIVNCCAAKPITLRRGAFHFP